MKRPTIKNFFPEDFTPKDVARMFHENPELKQYIHALDAYIDHLEGEKTKDAIVIPNMPIGFRVDVLPIPFMKKGTANLLVHPDNYPGKLELETEHGSLNVFRNKFLKHGEIGIMNLSMDPFELGGVSFPESNPKNFTPREDL